MVTTNAHIGNYGTLSADMESRGIQISGLVCKNFTNEYSRIMADADIDSFFDQYKVPVICDIDTRALVRHIRNKGAMNALITRDNNFSIEYLKDILVKVPSMDGLELASGVSTKEFYNLGDPTAPKRVAVMDYGVKRNILKCLTERGCQVRVFPAKTNFEEVEKWEPNAYF